MAHHALPAGVRGPHLGRDEHLIPDPSDGFPHQPLRAAVRIHLGGIDQDEPELEAFLERPDLVPAPRLVGTHLPCSLTDRRNALAAHRGPSHPEHPPPGRGPVRRFSLSPNAVRNEAANGRKLPGTRRRLSGRGDRMVALGVDVSARRGMDAVLLDDTGGVRLVRSGQTVADLRSLLAVYHPDVVAVDAPAG